MQKAIKLTLTPPTTTPAAKRQHAVLTNRKTSLTASHWIGDLQQQYVVPRVQRAQIWKLKK